MKPWHSTVIGILIGSLLMAAVFIIARQPQGAPINLKPVPTQSPLFIHVLGCVVSPGVYQLPPRSRIQDAVIRAGGLTDCTNLETLNLAAIVYDGQKIVITSTALSNPENPVSGDKTMSVQSPTQSVDNPININSASQAEFQTLPGIGEVKAFDIIQYREQHGPFTDVDDILNVPGIGEKTLNQLRNLITVDN